MLLLFIFLSGFLSVLTQNILIREIYTVFYGNELTYGLIITGWLAGAGIGAFIGRKMDEELFYLPFLTLSILLPVTVFFIRFLPPILGYKPGEIMGFLPLVIESFILLLPIYLIFGIIFSIGQRKFSQKISDSTLGATRPYIFDSLGDLTGGLAFSYLFVIFFSPLRNLFLISALSTVPVILTKGKKYLFLTAIFIIAFSTPGSVKFIRKSYSVIHSGFKVESIRETRYSRYMEISRESKISLINNGVLMGSFPDVVNAEKIHIPFILNEKREKEVLYLGFPMPDVVRELLKYQKCTVVNRDPFTLEYLKKYIEEKKLIDFDFIQTDPVLFVEKSTGKYDAVIIGIGDPLSISSNRYYSLEFAKNANNILREGGFLNFSISSGENYLEGILLDYNSLISWTYRKYFKYYTVVPGYRIDFIYSKNPLLPPDKIEENSYKELNLEYVDPYTLKSLMQEYRIEQVKENLESNFVGFNRKTRPKAFFFSLGVWLEKQGVNFERASDLYNLTPLILLPFLLLPLILRNTGFRVGLIGFVSMAVGYLCILSIQIIFGNLYHLVGLITGLFMFGVGIGTYISEKVKQEIIIKRPFIFLSLILTLLLVIITHGKPPLPYPVFIPLLNLAAGITVGLTYTNASHIYRNVHGIESGPPMVYAYDLIGGGIGAMAFSFFLIPIFGVVVTILILSGLCIFSIVAAWIKG